MRAAAVTVEEARAQGDLFAQRALNRAERSDPLFGQKARACIVDYLAANGETSGEILTNACKRAGIIPKDDRAFGSVYHKLLRDCAVQVTGILPRYKGHGSMGAKCYGLVKP